MCENELKQSETPHVNDTKYKPFEVKPPHLKSSHIKREERWKELGKSSGDISHRRFNTTLQVPQIVNAFKKCVHENEVTKTALITCYRVVLKKILQDPTLTDREFLSMYAQIQTRANEVYERRSKSMRNIKV